MSVPYAVHHQALCLVLVMLSTMTLTKEALIIQSQPDDDEGVHPRPVSGQTALQGGCNSAPFTSTSICCGQALGHLIYKPRFMADGSTVCTAAAQPFNYLVDSEPHTPLSTTQERQPSCPANITPIVEEPLCPANIPPNVEQSPCPANIPPNVEQSPCPANIPPNVEQSPCPANISPNVEQSPCPANILPDVERSPCPANIPPDVEQSPCPANIPPNVEQSPCPANVTPNVKQLPCRANTTSNVEQPLSPVSIPPTYSIQQTSHLMWNAPHVQQTSYLMWNEVDVGAQDLQTWTWGSKVYRRGPGGPGFTNLDLGVRVASDTHAGHVPHVLLMLPARLTHAAFSASFRYRLAKTSKDQTSNTLQSAFNLLSD
ncbi:hypothetical protein P7K49_027797 [Saguinus oedipus]|uniref:Uncharacterized protein n=1 Tax=Saguinus oedipus TaxID=9490 RepID=A0ABQ9UB79_SAGOE|nr:hypothetical protein P7K49_027797 [Saguinus oedipus]